MGNKGIKDQERPSFSVGARETPRLWMVKKLAKGHGHKWPAVAWECGQLGGGPEVPGGLRAPLKQPPVAGGHGLVYLLGGVCRFLGVGQSCLRGSGLPLAGSICWPLLTKFIILPAGKGDGQSLTPGLQTGVWGAGREGDNHGFGAEILSIDNWPRRINLLL